MALELRQRFPRDCPRPISPMAIASRSIEMATLASILESRLCDLWYRLILHATKAISVGSGYAARVRGSIAISAGNEAGRMAFFVSVLEWAGSWSGRT